MGKTYILENGGVLHIDTHVMPIRIPMKKEYVRANDGIGWVEKDKKPALKCVNCGEIIASPLEHVTHGGSIEGGNIRYSCLRQLNDKLTDGGHKTL